MRRSRPGRSLAVDPGYHALGTAHLRQRRRHAARQQGAAAFNRLMVAQDVGSAIKGPERGDIYFGSGDAAGTSRRRHQACRQVHRAAAERPAGASRRGAGQDGRGESAAMSTAGRKPGGGGRTITAGRGPAVGARDPRTRRRSRPSRASAPRRSLVCRRRLPPARPAQARKPQGACRRAGAEQRRGSARPRRDRRRRSPISSAARPARSPPARSRSTRRIDLHGMRQHEAHARLRAFLLGAHAEGHRTVLVITGKGGERCGGR